MCFFKKEKEVLLYVVIPNNNVEEFSHIKEPVFLTITSKKEECEEYIHKRLYLQKKGHYEQWCVLHEKDSSTKETWNEYIRLFPDDLIKYAIMKVGYKAKDIATIFRMFNQCAPIGTSYEDQAETYMFINRLATKGEEDYECNR